MISFKSLTEAIESKKNSNKSITFIDGQSDVCVLTYAQLYKTGLSILGNLQQTGLSKGDQLILYTKSNKKFVEVFWACILGGIIPVPVAVGISDEHKAKLMRIFNKLECPYLCTDQEHLVRLEQFINEHAMYESFNNIRDKSVLLDSVTFSENAGQPYHAGPDDIAFIQFSSGSTSEPKGVVLTHDNIVNNLDALATGADYREGDISLSWMPLTHDLGLLGFHINMLLVDISQCLMSTDLFSRRPLLWLQKASELKATVLCSPNFGYRHYLKAFEKRPPENLDLTSVRTIFNGAEPISLELCEEFLDRLAPYGLRRTAMWTVYGLAEATLAVALPPVETQYQAIYVDRHKVRLGDTVVFVEQDHEHALGFAIEGKAVKDISIKITDENNVTLMPNQIGLVQIKGPSVTQGFYMDEEASRKALTGDGWLNTGDLGMLTENNELVITGRHKDIIFANAQNYYPHDIEMITLQLPELELNKVVAYGVRRPKMDADDLLIFILYRNDISQFTGIVRDVKHHISQELGLEVRHVIPVNRIPKTTSGKLQRRLLGEAYLNGEYDEILNEIQQLLDLAHEKQKGDMSETEFRLIAIFNSVIKDEALTVQDNFYEAGLSSLDLTGVHQQIDEVWPGAVDMTDIFEYQTVAELAALIDQKNE